MSCLGAPSRGCAPPPSAPGQSTSQRSRRSVPGRRQLRGYRPAQLARAAFLFPARKRSRGGSEMERVATRGRITLRAAVENWTTCRGSASRLPLDLAKQRRIRGQALIGIADVDTDQRRACLRGTACFRSARPAPAVRRGLSFLRGADPVIATEMTVPSSVAPVRRRRKRFRARPEDECRTRMWGVHLGSLAAPEGCRGASGRSV
ncbi:hypothetical protein ACVWZV_001140 [Bradyrhizobium sp. GM5.1]